MVGRADAELPPKAHLHRGSSTMPGKHITNREVARYLNERHLGRNQTQSADSADISTRTATAPRGYQTRTDSILRIWPEQIEPLLQQDGHLRAVTLFTDLQRRHPGRLQDGQVRTLERRNRHWRAVSGPSKHVMFLEEHPPGWQALRDITDCDELAVTKAGDPLLNHLGHGCCPPQQRVVCADTFERG